MSEFVEEIPRELVDMGYENQVRKSSAFGSDASSGSPWDSQRMASPGGDFEGSAGTYAKLRQAFRAKAYAPRNIGTSGGALDYEVGDTVRHDRFGDGIVREIVKGGRDYEVTVDFDGTVKKMFASFANLHKIGQ